MNTDRLACLAARHAYLPTGVDREDLEQEARIGLWQAAPTHPAVAITIARRRIIDANRRMMPGPRGDHTPEPLSLELPVLGLEDEGVTLGDNLVSRGIDTTQVDVDYVLDRLPRRERFIARGLVAGLAQNEIAEMLGVTESRVCQIVTMIRDRLRPWAEMKDAA